MEKASLVVYDEDDFYWLACEADKDRVDCESVTLEAAQPIKLLMVTHPRGEDLSDLTLSVTCE